MNLTEEEAKKFREMVSAKENKNNTVFDGNVTEWLFRGLLALLLYLGNGIRMEQETQGRDITDVKDSLTKLQINSQYSEKDIATFRDILSKPRFTREDFDTNTAPIIKQLNLNTVEINSINQDKADMEKRITKLEYNDDGR